MSDTALRSLVSAGLALLLSPAIDAAPQNLDFEQLAGAGSVPVGWNLAAADDAAGAFVAIDTAIAAQGRQSLRIERRAAGGVTRLAQDLTPAELGIGSGPRRLRWSGAIRAARDVAASLWVRLDGTAGFLYLDSRGDGREPEPDVHAAATSGGSTGEGDVWRRFTLELPLPSDTDEVTFGVAVRGGGVAHFDALAFEIVDVAALPAPTAAARRYLDAALAIMREHALRTAAVDWPALRATTLELARGAITPADTHAALRFAVRALGDRHSYLQSPTATDELRAAPVANARTRQALVEPMAERLTARIGYLLVPGFAGGTAMQQVDFAESIKNLIQVHDSSEKCGWVVDLRRNSGGNLWPMLAGLGPLLGEGELAHSVYADGRRTPVWYRHGQAGFGDYVQLRVHEPYRLRSPVPPAVAVLTGRTTASSAEVLVLAFTGRAETRTFGAPTRGLSAGNRTFELADGAALVLTVAGTADRLDRLPTGPLLPDEPVATPAGTAAGDVVLAAGLAWLEAHAACAGGLGVGGAAAQPVGSEAK